MAIVNGQEEGMQKAWRENGKIYNNYEAKNGRIFGLKRASLCFQLEDEIVQNN
jgi:antitoxin component YwqK of YwqJK toxin-antitoxin module